MLNTSFVDIQRQRNSHKDNANIKKDQRCKN
jgi:hypothetical protein